MKVKIYLRVSEYAPDGFTLDCVEDTEGHYEATHKDYKLVGETEVSLTNYADWLASKGTEMAEEMELQARLDLEKKLSKVADFKSKFLSLTHEVES